MRSPQISFEGLLEAILTELFAIALIIFKLRFKGYLLFCLNTKQSEMLNLVTKLYIFRYSSF
ncbi:hypothetical protein, partial [Nodularia chucula]|uniref:hypothetical protein n=1 Tax=Nodularia chucula TaxID=3093667 RepID=UPI0039C67B18